MQTNSTSHPGTEWFEAQIRLTNDQWVLLRQVIIDTYYNVGHKLARAQEELQRCLHNPCAFDALTEKEIEEYEKEIDWLDKKFKRTEVLVQSIPDRTDVY